MRLHCLHLGDVIVDTETWQKTFTHI